MRTGTVLFLVSISVFSIMAVSPAHAGWTLNGAPVCRVAGVQEEIRACPTTTGASIITWTDKRSTANIYAQMLDEMGVRQWDTLGVVICGAADIQNDPCIVSDGEGGAIIAWVDSRGTGMDIYAQRVNAAGTVLWTADGVAVCNVSGNQFYPHIVTDGAGGAIIIWQDGRSGTGWEVYAQRLNSAGGNEWYIGGIMIGYGQSLHHLDVAPDGSGGALIVCEAILSDESLTYAWRLDNDGNKVWNFGKNNGADYYIGNMRITSDAHGGAIIAFESNPSLPYNTEAYAQRIDNNGVDQWGEDGVSVCATNYTESNVRLTGDGIGGAVLTWQDYQNGDHYEAYAQRIDMSGAVLWGASGVPVSAYGEHIYELDIVSDSRRGAIITWRDTRDMATSLNDIYVQRMDSLGAAQWTLHGEPLCVNTANQRSPYIITDGAGGAIVAWQDSRDTDAGVYAMRILNDGGYTATMLQAFSASPGAGGIIVEWTLSSIDDGTSFRVSRRDGTCDFVEMPYLKPERMDLRFTFTDETVSSGVEYYYRIDAVIEGEARTLFETGPVSSVPRAMALYQNVPNPFNPATTINYYLPGNCPVLLEVFDISGRRIAALINESQIQGSYSVEWHGQDQNGNPVSSGVYFYRLKAGKETISRKMILLR